MVLKNNSQKVIISLFAFALLLFSGCQISTDITQPQEFLSNSEQVLGFAALSAVQELQKDVVVGEVANDGLDREKIDSKLYIANTFLGDVANFNVDVQNNSLRGYDKIMIITYVDMNKNINTHEFHYNETVVEVEDDEIKSEIQGFIIVNGVEYTLQGIKEEEDEEFEYDLIAFLDDENYLTIKYEVENSGFEIEKEFEYERFVDNQLVYRIEIEFEVEEDGEREINIKFLDGDFESEYSFKSEIENGVLLK